MLPRDCFEQCVEKIDVSYHNTHNISRLLSYSAWRSAFRHSLANDMTRGIWCHTYALAFKLYPAQGSPLSSTLLHAATGCHHQHHLHRRDHHLAAARGSDDDMRDVSLPNNGLLWLDPATCETDRPTKYTCCCAPMHRTSTSWRDRAGPPCFSDSLWIRNIPAPTSSIYLPVCDCAEMDSSSTTWSTTLPTTSCWATGTELLSSMLISIVVKHTAASWSDNIGSGCGNTSRRVLRGLCDRRGLLGVAAYSFLQPSHGLFVA